MLDEERKQNKGHGRGSALTRSRLIELAYRHVTREGPETFGLRETAREAGFNASRFYQFFEDKDALLSAVGERSLAELLSELERAANHPVRRPGQSSALGRLHAVARGYSRYARDQPGHFRLIFGPLVAGRHAKGQIEAGTAPRIAEVYAHILAVVGRLPEPGASVDLLNRSIGVWAAVHGIASLLAAGALSCSSDAELHRLVDEVVVGLRIASG